LKEDDRRNATIKCISDCQFFTLTKRDYQEMLSNAEARTKELTIQFLKQVPFMKSITKRQMEHIIIGMETKQFIKNQVVCKQGDPSLFVFIVREGEFEITLSHEIV